MTNDCHITDRALTRSMVWKAERWNLDWFVRQQNRERHHWPRPREGRIPIMKINPAGR